MLTDAQLKTNSRINYVTEIAFAALVESAKRQELEPKPVMGLMYLPSEEDTRKFQLGCRAALASMGVEYQQDPEDAV